MKQIKTAHLEQFLKTGQVALIQFPWEDKIKYGCWLAQTYHMVKYTTRFASLTAGNLPLADEKIHQGLLNHLREENHHEKLAESDIKNLNLSLSSFPFQLETKLLIQNQFY